jgi:hypothetical protein
MATGDVTYFLKHFSPDDGGGGSNGGGGNKLIDKVIGKGNKDIKNELERGNKGAKKGLGATLGIKFGIASLLKQSQVFTGFVGTIFQLMGALVDVILAPFLPILIPGIRLIASLVPIVAKYAQAVYDYIDRTIFQWLSKFGWFDGVAEATKKALSAIIVGIVMLKVTGMWNVFKSLVNTFIGRPIWGIAKKFFTLAVWDTLKLKLMMLEDIIKAGAKKALMAVWDATGGKVVTAIDIAGKWLVKTLWTDGAAPIFKGIRAFWRKMMGETLGSLFTKIRARLIDPLFNILRGIGGFIAAPFKTLWARIAGDVATTGDSFLGAFFKRFSSLPVVGAVLKWANKEILGKLGGLFKGAKNLAGRAAGAVGSRVADLPGASMVGNMAKKLSPSALKNVAQGFKAIPVLGAVAELGFGAWATYKDYKKYGTKAALGRAALTLGNTTTALFDPTGLASAAGSIGSNIAMDQAYKRMLDPKTSYKENNPDIWVQEKNDAGILEWNKVDKRKVDEAVKGGASMSPDRPVMDGYYQ